MVDGRLPATPELQRELETAVFLGLVDGDLSPLLVYLRSPFPMPQSMRDSIADCIEAEETDWQITCKQASVRGGNKSKRRQLINGRRDADIAKMVDARVAEHGSKEAAVNEAAQMKNVSRSHVFAVLAKRDRGEPLIDSIVLKPRRSAKP